MMAFARVENYEFVYTLSRFGVSVVASDYYY